MVDEEHLESLDFMLWMSGSHRAARLTHTNQSTVIRRANTVLAIFGTEIHRSRLGWRDQAGGEGGIDLLQMERCVHQQFRFRGRRRLRLHTPFWSHLSVRSKLPDGWITTPPDPAHVCENPLDLLRQHVIDACLLTPTQIEAAAEDLFRIDLVHSVIDLTFFPAAAETLGSQAQLHDSLLEDPSGFQLQLFGFLPHSCREISQRWFASLFGASRRSPGAAAPPTAEIMQVAFLTPEMRDMVRSPFLVDPSWPRSYRETLVVLRQNAGEPRFHELADALQSAFGALPLAPVVAGNRREAQHHGGSAQV